MTTTGQADLNPNNPAGRLYSLLSEAQVPPRKGDRTQVRQRWAEVLGVDADDLPTLLVRLSELIVLPSKIREAIKAVPEQSLDKERFLRWLPPIEGVLGNLYLDNYWEAFAGPITAEVMVGLEFCDELLSRVAPDTIIAKDRRDQLHRQVQDLFHEVEEEEPDPGLREFILRHLSEIDRALQTYRISGTPPMRKAVEAAIGGVVVERTEKDLPRENPRLNKLGALATAILMMLNITTQTLELTERIFGPSPEPVLVQVVDDSDIVDAEVVDEDQGEGEEPES